MSIEGVKKALYKAMEDEEFRKTLLSNPNEALKGFDLSDDERSKFNNINADVIAMYKDNLDKRLSKAGTGEEMKDELDWWVDSVTD